MQNSLVDFAGDDLQKGFRLHRLEVLNWGTFNEKVWKIEPTGFNSLITGDIGSGKSTLVDAILTLLVPNQKIVYNKAAGAENRERTLNSYIRGEYKSLKSEFSSNSSPVYLREEDEYTVLLARFYNKGFESGYTLAQVFWMRNGNAEKFFVISKKDLRIKDHFKLISNEKDIAAMKKRLKNHEQTEVFDFFKDYSSKFRSYFGITSEKVLELFYQTVSMKSVGKLTDFMRNHMLEKQDIKEKIEEIKKNYENLTKSHEAVQRAKQQLELLTPINVKIGEYQTIFDQNAQWKKSIDFLPIFFADKKSTILDKEIQYQATVREQTEHEISKLDQDLENLRDQEKEIIRSIDQNKEGQRLNQLDKDINSLEKVKKIKLTQNQAYAKLCVQLNFFKDPDEGQFQQTLNEANALHLSTESDLKSLSTQRDSAMEVYRKLRDSFNEDKKELDSLTGRKTKIPEKNIQIRNLILTNLHLEESDLPFAGELLQIKKDEKPWEGAIERVLHSFGLSILVAERYYREVSSFVDKNNMKGRIVYYRIPDKTAVGKRKEAESNSLIRKIEIKPDSEFYDWISGELFERFNFICCDSIEEFQRVVRALTKNGQIKGNRGRHEKDDGKSINDQKNYVLGWNNQEKIRIIKEELAKLDKQIKENQAQLTSIDKNKDTLDHKKTNLHDLLKFCDYDEMDWKKIAAEIEKIKQEIEEIKRSSHLLKTLKNQLEELGTKIKSLDKAKNGFLTEVGKINSMISMYQDDLFQCKNRLSEYPLEKGISLIPIINSVLPDGKFEIKTIDASHENARKTLTTTLEENTTIERNIWESIIKKMQEFKQKYPEDTVEIVPSIEAIPDYRRFYEKIKTEDLPKYEKEFKDMLRTGTINDIAIFKSQLETNAKQIEKNIKTINQSLKTIEYSPGTYIELSSEKIVDVDIRTFQTQLRDCLEGAFGDKNPYSEDKFTRVKVILDRFKSGILADINWTTKVTDVRNWYAFSAIEKYAFDDKEKEYYSDSSGKSGGQKEKLAYTILASALAYRFGPAGDTPKSKSFRFVMIDEAFGKGSDESTRYGLELFKKLDLQLLIITPLQKIHVIENYINCVHFVKNNVSSSDSMTRDIPIKEYREKKMTPEAMGE